MEANNDPLNFMLRKESLVVKKVSVEKTLTKSKQSLAFTPTKELCWIIQQTPGLVNLKDHNSVLWACSCPLARLGNLATPEEIAGKHDGELPWGCNGYEDIFREEDKEVLAGNILFVLGKYSYADKNRITFVKKIPWLDGKERIKGLINYITVFEELNASALATLFLQHNIEVTAPLLETLNQVFLPKKISENEVRLSPREEECLYYLLQGYPLKKIASFTNLTYRTVECYLNRVKEKFECRTLQALILKAIEYGFQNRVPNGLKIPNHL